MSRYEEFRRIALESEYLLVQAERDFAAITALCRERLGRRLGEVQASKDPRRIQAQGDWLFHSRRARTYAALAAMEAARPVEDGAR